MVDSTRSQATIEKVVMCTDSSLKCHAACAVRSYCLGPECFVRGHSRWVLDLSQREIMYGLFLLGLTSVSCKESSKTLFTREIAIRFG